MALNWEREENGGNLMNFFGPLKTKQQLASGSGTGDGFTNDRHDDDHTLSTTNSPPLTPQQNSSSNTIEGSSSSNLNHNENWSSLAIISKFNAQMQAPIKRHKPVHCTNKLVNSTPLAPAIIAHPTDNLPKKRYPPPPSPFFYPRKNQRLYRYNFPPPSYNEPNEPSIGKNRHTVPIPKIRPVPLANLLTPTRTRSELSIPLYSSPSTSIPSSSALPSHASESTYNSTSPNMTSASAKHTLSLNKKNDGHRPNLSDEQRRVLDMVVGDRQSIFLTGSAGTGKSVLMREIISALRNKYGEAVAVTASTGIAACNIGGVTLHGFAGIGLGGESSLELIRKIEMNPAARERWQKTYILIIDEISMVDAILFDKLVDIGRHIRGINEGFGGIQVIVTGDFFQLPPVKASGFAFEAKNWPSVIKKTIILTHVFRQKDPEFVQVLNEMRVGVLSQKMIKLLKSLERPLPESSIEPTKLYPVKHQVERSNNIRLEALVGHMHEFEAIDAGSDLKKLENCIAPALVRLKKNAQVMLLKNIDPSLVNGSLGIVVGFAGEDNFGTVDSIMACLFPRRREKMNNVDLQNIISRHCPVVRFANGRVHVIENELWSIYQADGTEIATREQIPLVLAWALSIHKSQGQTLDRVTVDLEQSFEDGMAYVAISRATSLQSLQISNFNPLKVTTSPKVIEFYKTLQYVG